MHIFFSENGITVTGKLYSEQLTANAVAF